MIKKGHKRHTVVFSLFVIVFVLKTLTIPAQALSGDKNKSLQEIWVDSVYNSLTLDEKIAQLIFLRANNPDKPYFDEVGEYIVKYNIGGITFFGSTPYKQVQQTNQWQKLAKTPLLITIDAEYGLAMRLDSVTPFPYQLTLGAIQDDSLIYEAGAGIGKQCNEIGVQLNFAPVADVNNNANNPVINFRSFGENPENVILKCKAIARGMEDQGILVTAKHFPGHGDTDTDSHKSLPVIPYKMDRLDSIELAPFKALIKDSIDAVMIAHLYIPELDRTENLASTLSKPIVTNLLRDHLGFKGLIITDALEMKGVTKYFKPGEIEVKALQAGNDILLLPENTSKAIKSIKRALKNGTIDTSLIENRCKKILYYKYKSGLYKEDTVNTKNLLERLNNNYFNYLNEELFKNAITVLKNQNHLIPVQNTDTLEIASLVIGKEKNNTFNSTLNLYSRINQYIFTETASEEEIKSLQNKFHNYDLIIISLYGKSLWPKNKYGISDKSINFIKRIAEEKMIILNIFANPYALDLFDSTKNIEAILISYQNNNHAENASAQLIFGGIDAKGNLPISVNKDFPAGKGLITNKTRLEYTSPDKFGITPEDVALFDSIALSGIEKEAYPGCQVLAAKDGKVFYNKTFGYHTYNCERNVKTNDLYDLASITKIAATNLAIMKLFEEGRIDIDHQLQEYLPYLKDNKKGKLVIRDLLAHQGGLQAWIPYYKFTLNDNGDPDSLTYSETISEDFPIRVAEEFYIRDNYQYYIFDSIIYSPPRENFEYKYSDLGFYLLASIVENVSNTPFDKYLEEHFYKPLGMSRTTFKPRKVFPLDEIVPTEDDLTFRKQLIHGDVHDPGAAMLGGVSGHAGLFSNANDLTKIMYLLINNGTYGGKQFLDSSIIKEFTRCQFPLNLNRRGLGFDKPMLEYEEDGPNCKSASPDSYGHSGFTGTYVWADPKANFIYVFLSNRVHPTGNNKKLMELNIRTNLHQAIYDALSKEDINK